MGPGLFGDCWLLLYERNRPYNGLHACMTGFVRVVAQQGTAIRSFGPRSCMFYCIIGTGGR